MSQFYLLSNTAPKIYSVAWLVSNVPPWLRASPASGVLGPGQSATLTITLNPLAAGSLPVGDYSTNISIVDSTEGFTAWRFFSLTVVISQLVKNGGFETGAFTDWTLNGSPSVNFVANSNSVHSFPRGTSASTIAAYLHSGTYSALMGQSGDAFFSQTISTIPGQAYLVSFWAANPGLLTRGQVAPNDLSLQWGGASLFHQINMPTFTWTNFQFIAVATNVSTVLEFAASCNDYISLDDVSVQPEPTPLFNQVSSSNGSVALSWAAQPGLAYQLQYTTNLTTPSWVNIGSPITATNGVIGAADALPADSQRFYQLLLLP